MVGFAKMAFNFCVGCSSPHGAAARLRSMDPRVKPLEKALDGLVAESQPRSVAEWAVALRLDTPRATVLVLVLG